MIDYISRSIRLLNAAEKKSFITYQVFSSFVAVLETSSLALIAYSFALFSGNDAAVNYLLEFGLKFGIDSYNELFFIFCIFLIIFLFMSALLSVFNTWKAASIAYHFGSSLSNRLFASLLERNYDFYLKKTQTELVNIVQIEAIRVSDNFFYPLVSLSSKVAVLFFVSLALFIYDPAVFLGSITLLGGVYIVVFKSVKPRLSLQSTKISLSSETKLKLLRDVFSSIRDVVLFDSNKYFLKRFEAETEKHASAVSLNVVLSLFPRYFVEYIIISAVLIICMYHLLVGQGEFSEILPGLSFYALSALKLLPVVQQVYSSISQMEGNIRSFEMVETEIHIKMKEQSVAEGCKYDLDTVISSKRCKRIFSELSLSNVTFCYAGASKESIRDITLNIKRGQSVALVGSSGCGKTTLMNIMLGFLQPTRGRVSVKYEQPELSVQAGSKQWRRDIGYVPQNVYILGGTVADNVCFGLEYDSIDRAAFDNAVEKSHLDNVLPNGVDRMFLPIGEDGNRLSGGQRQRIGIARALYRNPSVLFFDEATSALDGISERAITDAIEELRGSVTTVTIAHRLSTVKNCDFIYLMEAGSIIAQGTYDELYDNSAEFRSMVGNDLKESKD